MTEHYTISSLKKELFVKIDEKNDYMKTIEYKKKTYWIKIWRS